MRARLHPFQFRCFDSHSVGGRPGAASRCKQRLPLNHSSVQRLALCVSVGLAVRLDIFDALVELGSKENPVSPKQVTDRNGLKERYIHL